MYAPPLPPNVSRSFFPLFLKHEENFLMCPEQESWHKPSQVIAPCFQIKSVCCNGSFFCLLRISLLKDTSRLSFASQEGRKTKKLNLASDFTLFTLI